MVNRIARNEYLDWLKRWREKQIIKVVSGVRRSGKSTLFDIYRDYLLGNGVEKEQVIMLNFEDIEYENLSDYRLLYDYVTERLAPDKMNYIFLDEIQHVAAFEKAVDSLFLKKNCDVYITGSNAWFLSSDLATVLSGRYVELKMLPLSFREYYTGLEETKQHGLSKREKFERYLEFSSFPYILRFELNKRETREYLQGLYNTVLLNDIVARKKITDVEQLKKVVRFMLHNIGNKTSATKIANTLRSSGSGADQKTVGKYLDGLTESLLLYEAPRYNIKGKQYLTTQPKYYAVDIGLRNMLVRGKESDIGHILENVVYLELLRRGYEVYVGEIDDGEVDFVARNDEGLEYYQIAATTLDEETLARELAPFRKITDNYPKTLLTLDDVFGAADYDGIKKRNLPEWLLEQAEYSGHFLMCRPPDPASSD
ncbi:ATP-binding protein [Desulfoscipio sp. XC116]|uniref:ATP-binding protein n=1 Tax=Desulfoscipio sp. XC116 TaxID=3144975 RepID=UPI00325AA03A